MATPRDTTVVVKGVISPSKDDVKKVVERIQSEIKANPKFAQQFSQNPRATIAAFGLNEDVQHELIRDMGVSGAAALPCVFTECIHTCWFTDCIITHITTKK